MANLQRPEFDEDRGDHEGFRARRARIGYQVKTERIGASLWEILPGEAAYPYHYHLGEEELIVVLVGSPTLRTPGGSRDLQQGDVVSFLPGQDGAHQLVNRTEDVVRFLALSTNAEPDIVFYPDSGKVGAVERLPQGTGYRAFFQLSDEVDYWHGEQAPAG